MIPEPRFVRWISVGVPVVLVEAIAIIFFVHLRYLIAWRSLLPPVSLCLAIQIGFFIGAFWAGKLAREKRKYGPISILAGFSFWATLLIVMHYGPLWGILSPVGSPMSFSIFMVFVTLVSWFAISKLNRV